MRQFPLITKEKIKEWIKKAVALILNPRLLLCLAVAWMITNGWSYIFIAVGGFFRIEWMLYVGSAYGALLWFPFTPEKIITVAIAIFLLRIFFPKDEKTLGVLRAMLQSVKKSHRESVERRRKKREERKLCKAERKKNASNET